LFQRDLYPDANSAKPAQEASDWFVNKTLVEPNKVSMETFFTGKNKKDVAGGTSGGLKKGGLKGLKTRKEAKNTDAKPAASAPAPASEVITLWFNNSTLDFVLTEIFLTAAA